MNIRVEEINLIDWTHMASPIKNSQKQITCWGIQEEGGPVVPTIFAFFKNIMSTMYLNGDGNTTCVLIKNLNQETCY